MIDKKRYTCDDNGFFEELNIKYSFFNNKLNKEIEKERRKENINDDLILKSIILFELFFFCNISINSVFYYYVIFH